MKFLRSSGFPLRSRSEPGGGAVSDGGGAFGHAVHDADSHRARRVLPVEPTLMRVACVLMVARDLAGQEGLNLFGALADAFSGQPCPGGGEKSPPRLVQAATRRSVDAVSAVPLTGRPPIHEGADVGCQDPRDGIIGGKRRHPCRGRRRRRGRGRPGRRRRHQVPDPTGGLLEVVGVTSARFLRRQRAGTRLLEPTTTIIGLLRSAKRGLERRGRVVPPLAQGARGAHVAVSSRRAGRRHRFDPVLRVGPGRRSGIAPSRSRGVPLDLSPGLLLGWMRRRYVHPGAFPRLRLRRRSPRGQSA
jgi:hypothetical protein